MVKTQPLARVGRGIRGVLCVTLLTPTSAGGASVMRHNC